MQVCLPYSYEVEFRVGSNKKSERRFLVGQTTFELPELSSSDVSPAAEWTQISKVSTTRSRAISWDGGLYVPADPDRGIPLPLSEIPKTRIDRNVFSASLDSLYGGGHGPRCSSIRQVIWGAPGLDVMPAKSVVINSTHTEEKRYADTFFSTLVSIDGFVWKRVPHVAMSLFSLGSSGYVFSELDYGDKGLAGRYASSRSYAEYLWSFWHALKLPLNDTDQWQRFISQKHPGKDFRNIENIVIHDEEAMRFDVLDEFVVRGSKQITGLMAEMLGTLEKVDVDGWLGLRKIVETASSGGSPEISNDDIRFLVSATKRFDANRDPSLLENLFEMIKDLKVGHAPSGKPQSRCNIPVM